ncbi:rhamnan synthesis F family protein [Variovorax sp. J22R24]|uniref:rhamnan synthesis F family protein n=1 Tax=Variovorax gracilis TaxID=3053502 RepID=UPI002578895F|nr:rhamnan synthesis F family protein [Variovorax sp. J22R24]MDM0108311.1 rhamnan synthesis F family protein [Variovorax sp. J22R24]
MKRLCLFAGFSGTNQIDDHVVHYVRELSRFSDVYYQAANEVREGEFDKLDGIARGCWAQAHDKYDFGSWQKLFFRLGWQEVEKYDAIILANDSNFGPVRDLGGLFGRMDGAELDAWGITENYGVTRHLQSYFLVLNRPVIDSAAFRDFFESIAIEKSKDDVCLKYEIGLSRLLSSNGFSFAAFVDRSVLDVPFGADVSSYQNTLLRCGSPFLKRKIVSLRGFAKEDVAHTRTLLQELRYPLEIPAPMPPEEMVSTAVEAPVESGSSAEMEMPASQAAVLPVASPSGLSVRAGIKRLLRPFYQPIKIRVVDKLHRIDHHVVHLIDKTNQVDSDVGVLRNQLEISSGQLRSLESSIQNLMNVTAGVRGQLSGVLQNSKSAISQITDIQGNVSNLAPHMRDAVSGIAAIQGSVSELSPHVKDGGVRLGDLQTSVTELHGHLDWVQRDILIALMSDINLRNSKGFKCVTDYPVAYDSPDHIHPVGTVLDHTRHPRFIRACEDYFGSGKQLSFLDIGCSAGGIVLDAVLRGHIGVGLEGSDISRLQQRAEWRLLGDCLFTCDVTRPFELSSGEDSPFKFDVISAWEVLEHLSPDGVEGMFANLARHTHSGSVFACSISQVDGGFTEDGVPLHQTLEPLPWWRERAAKYGFDVLDSDAFSRLDFARGNGNSSVYYRPAHSYRESEGDCFLVVFQRR